MTVYHYTNPEHWPGIKYGSPKSNNRPGLAALLTIGFTAEEARSITASFALFEPEPQQWIQNPHFPGMWTNLTADIGQMLLEIETDPTRDPIYVIDRGHVEGPIYEDQTTIPPIYRHPHVAVGEIWYARSMVHLAQYLDEGRDYSLPEVISTDLIPFERITVSAYQPLLEERLAQQTHWTRGDDLAMLSGIPELQPWLTQYQGGLSSPEGINPTRRSKEG